MGQSGKPTTHRVNCPKGVILEGSDGGRERVSGVGSSLENPCVLED